MAVIYSNYNRIQGCSLKDFSFVHACIREINGKACAQLYPVYNHQSIAKRGISPSRTLRNHYGYCRNFTATDTCSFVRISLTVLYSNSVLSVLDRIE